MSIVQTNIEPKKLHVDVYAEIFKDRHSSIQSLNGMFQKTNGEIAPKYKFELYNNGNDEFRVLLFDSLDIIKDTGFTEVVFRINEERKNEMSKWVSEWMTARNISALNNPFVVYLSTAIRKEE